jgi:hypothetical protein
VAASLAVERALLRHFARLWVLEALAGSGPSPAPSHPLLLPASGNHGGSGSGSRSGSGSGSGSGGSDWRVLAQILGRSFTSTDAVVCRRLHAADREQTAYAGLHQAALRGWLLPAGAGPAAGRGVVQFSSECCEGLRRHLALVCHRARNCQIVSAAAAGTVTMAETESDAWAAAAAAVEMRPDCEGGDVDLPLGGLGLALLALGPLAEFAAKAGASAELEKGAAEAAAEELAEGIALAALLAHDDVSLISAAAAALATVPEGGLRPSPVLRALAEAARGAAARMAVREAPFLSTGARHSADVRRYAALAAATHRATARPDVSDPPRWEAACLDLPPPPAAAGTFAVGDKVISPGCLAAPQPGRARGRAVTGAACRPCLIKVGGVPVDAGRAVMSFAMCSL